MKNLKAFVDGGELGRNINQKKNSHVYMFLYLYVYSVKNVVGNNISSISNWNIVNQLGKHEFFLWIDNI